MRLGVMVSVLNAADSIGRLIQQFEGRCDVFLVLESVDNFRDPDEHREFRSVDDTRQVVDKCPSATFMPLGKVADPRHVLTKGLQLLNDMERILVLKQGDLVMDIDGLLAALLESDVLVSRRSYYQDDALLLGEPAEIAYRNSGGLRYIEDPFRVALPSGASLQESTPAVQRDGLLACAPSLAEQEHDRRVRRFFEMAESEQTPFADTELQEQIRSMLLEPVALSTAATAGEDLPKALAWNAEAFALCPQFVEAGWVCQQEGEPASCDMIFCIGELPEVDRVLRYMNRDTKLVVIEVSEITSDSRLEVLKLKERNDRLSFVARRR